MKNIEKILISMLVSPDSKKVYKELVEVYSNLHREEEVQAFQFLLKEKFHGDNTNYNS